MAEKKRDQQFAPMPMRAWEDKSFCLKSRVLMYIAGHDRFGANGMHCHAGQKRMAEAVGTDLTRINKTLKELAKDGYIDTAPHPLNKRLRQYWVIYTDRDRAVAKGENVGQSAKGRVGQSAKREGETLGAPESQAPDVAEQSDINILSETRNISGESLKDNPEGHALRRAPAESDRQWDDDELELSHRLRLLESAFKEDPDNVDLPKAADWLCRVCDDGSFEHGDPEYHWAERLLTEVDANLDAPF